MRLCRAAFAVRIIYCSRICSIGLNTNQNYYDSSCSARWCVRETLCTRTTLRTAIYLTEYKVILCRLSLVIFLGYDTARDSMYKSLVIPYIVNHVNQVTFLYYPFIHLSISSIQYPLRISVTAAAQWY